LVDSEELLSSGGGGNDGNNDVTMMSLGYKTGYRYKNFPAGGKLYAMKKKQWHKVFFIFLAKNEVNAIGRH
jgi:hypothetical protein